MALSPTPTGFLIAGFWLILGCVCLAWGGARLFLPPKKPIRSALTYLSRVQKIHAYRKSKRQRSKRLRYRLAGLSVLLAGAFGIYFGIRMLMES